MPNLTHKTPSFTSFNFSKLKTYIKRSDGITLVELMVVLAVLGSLTAVLLTTVNTQAHRKNALDGVIRGKMQQLVEAVESYRTSEGLYPSGTADPQLAQYIVGGWITNQPTGVTYNYNVDASRLNAGLMVTLNSGRVLKYRSSWGQIRDCAATAQISDDACP